MCFRKILRIKRKEKIINDEVHKRSNLDGAMLQTKQEEDGDYELDIVSGRVVAALQGNL